MARYAKMVGFLQRLATSADMTIGFESSCKPRVKVNSPLSTACRHQQLAINVDWDLVGGKSMLPGTISAVDRYVRACYDLKSSP
jgi:hypothetical protein